MLGALFLNTVAKYENRRRIRKPSGPEMDMSLLKNVEQAARLLAFPLNNRLSAIRVENGVP